MTQNLADYSSYVFAAYALTGLIISGFTLFVVAKYWRTKSKKK